MQAIESKAQPSSPEPTNASGTHRPGHYIRGLCAARDRRRAKGHLAVAGSAACANGLGGWRFASRWAARNRTAGIAGRGGAALCAAQATAAVELRRAGLSPGGFGLVPSLCAIATGLVAKEIGAAPDDLRHPPRDLGGGQSGAVGQRPTGQLESGATVRIDSTVTAALMHEPSDSALLWDAVRVMTRLLRQAAGLPGAPALQWRDRRRLAKKRARAIEYSRGKDKRRQLYRELIAATRATQAALQDAVERLADLAGIAAMRWRARVDHYQPLIERILSQSERRVLDGLAVPAGEKLVSLFEPHADIIVKGAGDVQYGHKLNLTTGKSGLILDVVVEAGNPADAERFLPMLDRQIACCGVAPRQIAADGGHASLDNLKAAGARGVRDVAFHKKRGLALEDMVKSRWVYRRLRNFRAGIEAGISCLKRAYGLARCTWRGLDHFKTYIWSAVVAHNLVLFARLKLA